MFNRQQGVGSMLIAAMLASTVVLALPARAEGRHSKSKEKTAKIGTLVGAAATGYALSKGKGTWALIGAGATLYSYSQWKKQVGRRHRDEKARRAAYARYRRDWQRNHPGRGRAVGHNKGNHPGRGLALGHSKKK